MPDYYYPNNSYYPQQRPYQQHQNGLLWVQGEEAAKRDEGRNSGVTAGIVKELAERGFRDPGDMG